MSKNRKQEKPKKSLEIAFKNAISFSVAEKINMFMSELEHDEIIVLMKCSFNDEHNCSSIYAELAKPYISYEKKPIAKFTCGNFIMRWDSRGKIIKSEKWFP